MTAGSVFQVGFTLSQATKALRESRGIALLYFRPLHLKGVRGQRHAPAAPYPQERPGTHCTGGWVDLRAGLPSIQYNYLALRLRCFLIFVICCFQFNLLSKCSPRYLTVCACGMMVLLKYSCGMFPFRSVNVICVDLFWLIFNLHLWVQFSMLSRWVCRLKNQMRIRLGVESWILEKW